MMMLLQGWATFMIKRATFFIITIGGPHDCTLQLNVSWEKLHHFEFGRYDFLYSGAFWGWPLPKKSSRNISYVRYVNWTNIHSFHVFHAQTATWMVSIFYQCKGLTYIIIQWSQKTEKQWPNIKCNNSMNSNPTSSCSSYSGDLSGYL